MLRDVVSSQFTNIGQTGFTSSPFYMWPKSVESGTPRVPANGFHTGLCYDYSMEVATTTQVPIRGIGRPLRGKTFTFLYEKARFSYVDRPVLRASQIAVAKLSSPDSSSDLYSVFHAHKQSLPDAREWNCSHMSLSASLDIQLMLRQFDFGR